MAADEHNGGMEAAKRQRELVQRAVDGDEVALTLLLTESRAELCEYVSGKISPSVHRLLSADDVVQEAHAEVFRRISSFRPIGGDSFDRWVAAIAIRRLRSAIRRHRAAKRGGGRFGAEPRHFEDSTIALLDFLAGPGKTPSRVVARGEAVGAVQEALADLPEQQRQAVWLVHIEGCTAGEAATQMGRTERAIHGLCRRGLENMRNQLESASRFLSSSG